VSLQVAGLLALVVLILVGALLPLKYTARLHLPHSSPGDTHRPGKEPDAGDDGLAEQKRLTGD